MELLVNDLSIHKQFPDLSTFRRAMNRVMAIRQIARRFGRELYCHRNVAWAQVTPEISMIKAMQIFDRNEKLAVLQWLTRFGPFWEDAQQHSSDEYLECKGEVVTDTALGEAAYCCFHGIQRRLVSFVPSSWQFSPVSVIWVPDGSAERVVEVFNHWEVAELEDFLRVAPVPLESWEGLATVSRRRCPNLTFTSDSFMPLRGHPFAGGAARRILALLDTLDRLKTCFDERGQRTEEGHRIYQDHFAGVKAWFSDSSDSEKSEFRRELTFRNPETKKKDVFCSWHGKIKTPQLRIHFSWPMRASEPLYVVYVGPKITKR